MNDDDIVNNMIEFITKQETEEIININSDDKKKDKEIVKLIISKLDKEMEILDENN